MVVSKQVGNLQRKFQQTSHTVTQHVYSQKVYISTQAAQMNFDPTLGYCA